MYILTLFEEKVEYKISQEKNIRKEMKLCPTFFFGVKKRCFHLFVGNPSIVNSPFQRESNPGGGSYSRNPFTTGPTRRWYANIWRQRNSAVHLYNIWRQRRSAVISQDSGQHRQHSAESTGTSATQSV